MDNPERGTSTINAYTYNGNICYLRGRSCITIPIAEIYKAYIKYKGKRCTSKELKEFRPNIFSSKRHGCNCSFFFTVLHEMGLCSKVRRSGNGNSSFCVDVF
jgi:hypothetical protein